MRRIATVAALVLVASLAFAMPAASTDCASDVYLRNFKIEMEPSQATYRLGDEAAITLTLTRKDTGLPVVDNPIALGLYQSRTNIKAGRTDSRGRWTARFVLKSPRFEPGPVGASAYSEKRSNDPLCPSIVEYGSKKTKELFTIRR